MNKPEYINVLPINDIQVHSHQASCPCNPRVEAVGINFLIIHNAFDGRDLEEERRDIYKN